MEKHIAKIQFMVPVLWWYETANVLTIARRRNRIKQTDIDTVMEVLEYLPIRTDYSHDTGYIQRVLSFTQDYTISAYDAVYLEAALRNHASLATLDNTLSQVAGKAGIGIVKI